MSRLTDLIAKARIPQLGADLAREFRALSARLAEIIQRLNELFHGDLTDGDQVGYVMNVIRGKLLESPMLRKQLGNNTAEKFSHSPDIDTEHRDAIIDSSDAHATMSAQALQSKAIRDAIKDILLGPGKLYEALRT